MASIETANSFKNLLNSLGINHYDFREKPFYINPDNRSHYLFNTSIKKIEESDFIVLVGTNPRLEATMLNARIRKTFLNKKLPIYSIGNPGDLTYDYKVIGENTQDLRDLINNKTEISKQFTKSKKPMIIIGESVLELKSAKNILSEINDFLKKNNFINENWNALNILIQNASTVGAIDLNFLDIDGENNFVFFEKLNKGDFKLIYFVGSDNLDFTKKDEFIIYQGSHGDRMAQIADVILPAAAYTEQNGIFINLEGKMQECIKATYPPGDAKEDWKIFNLISKHLIDKENFKNFIELRKDCISKIK